MELDYYKLAGRVFHFDDGASLRIVQVKERENGPWVTYEGTFNNSLPRRLVMPAREFVEHYAHLFPELNEGNQDGNNS